MEARGGGGGGGGGGGAPSRDTDHGCSRLQHRQSDIPHSPAQIKYQVSIVAVCRTYHILLSLDRTLSASADDDNSLTEWNQKQMRRRRTGRF